MYRDGRGVPQNYDNAYTWFNLAAAAGNEEAARERDIAAANTTLARQAAPVPGYNIFWLFAVFAMGLFFTTKGPVYRWGFHLTQRLAKEREQTQRERKQREQTQREQELARRRRAEEEEARRQQEHANARRSKPDSAKPYDCGWFSAPHQTRLWRRRSRSTV